MDYVIHQPTGLAATRSPLPGQVVLVFQGGGALGAYQGGVYQAMHETGIEPDWVVGTSIGAINAAIIAGNDSDKRLDLLRELWTRIERKPLWGIKALDDMAGHSAAYWMTMLGGIPGYFKPNSAVAFGLNALVGVENAAFYKTDDLRKTLSDLIDFHASTPDRRG